MGLERGPLSLVSTIQELLERKSSGSGLEIREYGQRDHPQVQYTLVISLGLSILQRIRCFGDFRRYVYMWCTQHSITFLHFHYNVKIIN
jgi:hypothetical protein